VSRSSKFFTFLVVWIGTYTGSAGLVHAQFGVPAPVIPGNAVPATGTAVPGGLTAPAAAPRTLWSSLGLSPASIHACRDKLCASQLGQMMNSMLLPMGAITGGVIPTFCPPIPNAAGLANQAAQTGGPAGPAGAQAAAAAIQSDVAGAGARIAAIEYLATVDCHYWPEAEVALIGRLRGDRVECVRFAAARALGSGCCCTKKTIEALQLVVAGDDKDGFPSETSERVRVAAATALQNCMFRFEGKEPAPEPRESPEPATPKQPEPPDAGSGSPFGPRVSQGFRSRLGYYETTIQRRSLGRVTADARRTLALARSQGVGKRTLTTGNRSVFAALARASAPSSSADRDATVVNLEHEEVSKPQHSPVTNTPKQEAQANPRRPVDGSVTRASDPDAGKERRPRSVFHLMRRSLQPRAQASQEEPDSSRQ
jgi:hypothetical protein